MNKQNVLNKIPSNYNAEDHLMHNLRCPLIMMSALVGYAFALLNFKLVEFLTIPLFILLFSCFEWLIHKFLLHKNILKIAYEHHIIHHQLFSWREMGNDDEKQMYYILTPKSMVLILTLLIIPVMEFCIMWLFGLNIGLLFGVIGYLYFICYEVLHMLFHSASDSDARNNKVINYFAQLHSLHHHPKFNTFNFNVIHPLFDIIFGSLYSKTYRLTEINVRYNLFQDIFFVRKKNCVAMNCKEFELDGNIILMYDQLGQNIGIEIICPFEIPYKTWMNHPVRKYLLSNILLACDLFWKEFENENAV